MEKYNYDAVVVGAGLSGLMAAKELEKNGLSVKVIEARHRVGGRTYSKEVGAARLDFGAQWVGKTQTRVIELVEELGLQLFPTFDDGYRIIEVGGKRTKYKNDIPSLSIWNLIELQTVIWRINSLCKNLDTQFPEKHRKAKAFDGMTVETWLKKNTLSKNVLSMLTIFVRAVFAAEPREMSMLYFLNYIKAGGDFNIHAQVKDGAQEFRIAGGTQQLSEGMADKLREPISFNQPVERIEWDRHGAVVITKDHRIFSRKVVIAVSPVITQKISFQPSLPMQRVQLIQRMPIGSDIKIVLGYERPFWRDQELSGQVVSDSSLLNFTYDNTSIDNEQASMVAFITGDQARVWGERSFEDRKQAVLGQLAEFFGDDALKPTHYVEQNWNLEEFSGGCPVGMGAPGALTQFGQSLRVPVGPIYWAGTETATKWCGFMEGALESGQRVAKEISVDLEVGDHVNESIAAGEPKQEEATPLLASA